MGDIKDYRDLIVWQKSMDLVVEIYKITEIYPKSERFGLVSQMQRSAVSIPSNIAEGYRRGTKKDYRNFVLIAYGSSSELETQVEIAKRLQYISQEQCGKIDQLLLEVAKMLNALQKSLK